MGAALPACCRSTAQVVGISCREAVFSTTKVTMALLAVSFCRFSFCSSCMAASPSGVAALPSPSRLAERFIQMACRAGPPAGSSGNSRRVSGRNRRATASVSRHCWAIFIRPHHRHSIPVREMTSVTASPQPESAAAESASIFPPKAALTTEKISIPTNTAFIMADLSPLFCLIFPDMM